MRSDRDCDASSSETKPRASFVFALGLIATLAAAGCGNPNAELPGPAAADAEVVDPDAALDAARRFRVQAYYDSALISLSSAMKHFYAERDTVKIVEALLESGRLASIRGSHRAALDSIWQIEQSFGLELLRNHGFRVQADVVQARTFVRMGQAQQALHQLSRYGPTTTAEIHAVRGFALYEQDLFAAAIKELETALRKLGNLSTDELRLRSRITTNLALAWFNHVDDFATSKMYLDETLDVRKGLLREDHPQLAEVFGNLGMILLHAGLLEGAKTYLTRAARIFARGGSDSELNLAVSYSNLGRLYWEIGDYHVASAFLRRSVNLRQNNLGAGHPRLYYPYSILGLVHLELGQLDEAIRYSELAQGIAAKLPEGARKLAAALANTADIHMQRGDSRMAFTYYDRAIAMSQDYGTRLDLAVLSQKKGRAHFSLGEQGRAKQELTRAKHFLSGSHIKSDGLEIRVANDLAEVFLAEQNNRQAVSLINEAVQQNLRPWILSLHGMPGSSPLSYEEYLRSLLLRASISLQECESESAKHSCDLGRVTSELKTGAKVLMGARQNLSTKEARRFWDVKYHRLVAPLVDDLGRLSLRSNARALVRGMFALVEATKAGALVDRIPELEAGSRRAVHSEVAVLQHQILLSQTRLGDRTIGDWQETETRLARDRLRYDQLLRRLERDHPTFHAINYGIQPVSADTLAERLGDSDALIEFFVTGANLYMITISSAGWSLTSLDNAVVASHTAQLNEAIAGQDFDNYVAAASGLYDAVLRPVEHLLARRNLVVIPDGLVHNIPFEALLYRQPHDDEGLPVVDYSTLPYLITRHAVSYGYSATLRQILSRRRPTSPIRQFLGVAPAHFRPGTTPVAGMVANSTPAPLPGAEQEIQELRNLFDPPYRPLIRWIAGNTKVLTGNRANEETFKTIDLSDYRFIHFATHGILNDSIPELSGLVFHPSSRADDDVLHLGEIYALELNADLVVLSSCDSGRGKLVDGNGVIGLAGGFLYAGARSVLASLWQVDDTASAELMIPFYTHLLRGRAMRQSLRDAKLELISQGGQHSRPYYWASHILFDS